MTTKTFSHALGEIGDKYITEANEYTAAKEKNSWLKWGAMAACLCLVVVGTFGWVIPQLTNRTHTESPPNIQISSPAHTVSSIDEMEDLLGYEIPNIDKEAEKFTVFFVDNIPNYGEIKYHDGSVFRMKEGSGDVSGIYGGSTMGELEIDGIVLSFYQYETLKYTIWEQNNYSFCLSSDDWSVEEIKTIINQMK